MGWNHQLDILDGQLVHGQGLFCMFFYWRRSEIRPWFQPNLEFIKEFKNLDLLFNYPTWMPQEVSKRLVSGL